ncbi:MAG TPA: hypothetical protein VLZ30_01185 [Verrucomicrobiae bacterium]|nr:hypothetical protein [Verrucomicrobiae bacterium]
MTENRGRQDKRLRVPIGVRELLIGVGFSLMNAAAHLVWNPIVEYWQYAATTLMFVGFLTFWLTKEWRRIESFVTKFYCVAVIFDVFAEGLLQPFHHCTFDNLLCTGKLFLVFFVFWLVGHPIERWLAGRRGGLACINDQS